MRTTIDRLGNVISNKDGATVSVVCNRFMPAAYPMHDYCRFCHYYIERHAVFPDTIDWIELREYQFWQP